MARPETSTRAGSLCRVSIVGVGESELGVTGKSSLELLTQAAVAALADAGLTVRDVDGLATAGPSSGFSASLVAEYLGMAPRWVDSTDEGGASYEIFTGHALAALQTGQADVVLLTYGSSQRSAGTRGLSSADADPNHPLTQYELPYGPLLPISAYALAAQRHMHEYGTTSEQLAEVAVGARDWALLNPQAYRYNDGPLTVDDVLASRMISSPLHVRDCCLVTDGGGAVVLTRADRARDLRQPPIDVLGFGSTVTHRSLSQMPDLLRTGAVEAATEAFAGSGLGPSDIDLAQIYDSFTITVLLSLEALGFCGPGESGPFVEDGRLRPGGELPINTSGGGLSNCHPGVYGIFLLTEATRQLRGQAGERQVADCETALCHGTGGYLNSHSTVILGIQR